MRAGVILPLFVLALVFVGCLDAYLAERRAVDTGTPSSPSRPATKPKEEPDEGARRDRAADGHVGGAGEGLRAGRGVGGPGGGGGGGGPPGGGGGRPEPPPRGRGWRNRRCCRR